MGINYNPFSLEGKTILVTGASSGIGKATAIECSKMGATCIITGRNEQRLQETLEMMTGDNHIQVIADLTKEDELKSLIDNLPVLDGAALCAGVGLTLPILFSAREYLDKMFETNFFSPFETLRLMVKKKKLSKSSSVVLIDSIGGTFSWAIGNGAYGTSKAALQSAMHYFAVELGPKQIRVNTIHPGMVETPLIHRGTINEEQLSIDMKRYPLGRYGQATEIAHGVIYLLSDASSWTTGHSLVIDGGVTAK